MSKESAIFVVNSWLEQDDVLLRIFGGPFNIFPGYADEALSGDSFPYIRYHHIPVVSRNQRIRKDYVQYFVGDKDFDRMENILERLMYKLDSDTSTTHIAVPDPSGKYRIDDIIVRGGTVPALPSQDQGVWEHGIQMALIYVIREHIWADEMSVFNSLDSLTRAGQESLTSLDCIII